MISNEEIESFLHGNDPEEFIVAIEFDYASNCIYKIKEIISKKINFLNRNTNFLKIEIIFKQTLNQSFHPLYFTKLKRPKYQKMTLIHYKQMKILQKICLTTNVFKLLRHPFIVGGEETLKYKHKKK